ncbi:MAG TPA: SUMF1/EgtB/PvdO family nonheme iron enzyme, partial [Pyrinomonadaceae bacterium]|nr:SUMF1/EgtB/PvdO family nonheme iron enzyme [Pyrinomonadaceae bacterium]
LRDSYRRQRELRLKYAFGVVCLVIIGVVIILSIPSKKPPEEQVPTPTPSASVTPSATATPSPTASPTPLQMVLIEGGEFQMGRDMKDGGDPYESPSHPVTLNAFYIDVYEVTREEYQKCIDDGKCEKPSEWNGGTYPADTGRLPVTGVTWEDANRYALWAGKRLPTEEEWEFAARGAEGRLYPWGNNWKPGQANIGSDGLAEVGSFKGTLPVKLFDMIGNAQEWTSSGFRKYPDKKTYLLTGFPPEQLRVIRGGSYKDSPGKVTATYRDALRMSGEASYAQTGFRCVRNAPPPPVN